tara:strand:- start:58 stop:1737 length:1680 start_codon:yes stop_codon:yes gene_type:complete
MNQNIIKIILISLISIILINLLNSFRNNNTFCKVFSLNKNNNIIENFYGNTNTEPVTDQIELNVEELGRNIRVLIGGVQQKIDNVQDLFDGTNDLKEEVRQKRREWQDTVLENISISNNYNSTPNRKCYQKSTDILDSKKTLLDCSNICSSDPNCLSFSHDKITNDCRLSTICDDANETSEMNYDNTLHTKKEINTSINNFNLKKNKQSNNLCKDEIENISVGDVHQCSNRCQETSKCVSFEYTFNDNDNENNCSLRKVSNENIYIENNNEYICELKNIVTPRGNKYIKNIKYNIDEYNREKSYTLRDLKKNCSKECDNNKDCNAFSYYFNSDSINCDLYRDLKGNISTNLKSDFKHICQKNPDADNKNLYIHKENNPDQIDIDKCEGVCEYGIPNDMPYIKFFKNLNDKNYSYITFTDMYDVQKIDNFNFSEYTHINIQKGFEVQFFDEDDPNILNDKILSNPPSNSEPDYVVNFENKFMLPNFEYKNNLNYFNFDKKKVYKIKIKPLPTQNCTLSFQGPCNNNYKTTELYYDITGRDLQNCRNNPPPGINIPDDRRC